MAEDCLLGNCLRRPYFCFATKVCKNALKAFPLKNPPGCVRPNYAAKLVILCENTNCLAVLYQRPHGSYTSLP